VRETGRILFEAESVDEERPEGGIVEVTLYNHQILLVDNMMALKYLHLPPDKDSPNPEAPRRKMKIVTHQHHPVRLLRGKYKTDSKKEAPLGAYQVTVFKLRNGLAHLHSRFYDIVTQTVEDLEGAGLQVSISSPVPLEQEVVTGRHMRKIMQDFNAFHSNLGIQPIPVFEG